MDNGRKAARRETIIALLDDVLIAGAASGIAAILLNRAGVVGALGAAVLVAAVTGVVAVVVALVYRVHSRKPQVGPEALLGSTAVVIEEIPPGGEGIVELEGELWRAESASGRQIGRGERVRVVGVKGLVLLVEPVEPSP